ncbi:hypothetical protein PANT_7c00107 [Moesziomyces antarcticus T-34]|uniref:Uncharacterized protein n=1 Tax=Pseudozyma antarctica (strain T-34) TaxID=1151754 RepID=M9MBF3_PSEA3|nr:hypothetical protein PANT_7c00107 [Moesziomyces antarcticus T-34]
MKSQEVETDGKVEMFPSSAVAQSHAPGSDANIGTLQQPPAHHHQRTSSFYQPPFDLSGTKADGADSSVQAADSADQQQKDSTMVSTNTASDSAMMPAQAAANGVGNAQASTDKAATNADQTADNSPQSAAVRKIRSADLGDGRSALASSAMGWQQMAISKFGPSRPTSLGFRRGATAVTLARRSVGGCAVASLRRCSKIVTKSEW